MSPNMTAGDMSYIEMLWNKAAYDRFGRGLSRCRLDMVSSGGTMVMVTLQIGAKRAEHVWLTLPVQHDRTMSELNGAMDLIIMKNPELLTRDV